MNHVTMTGRLGADPELRKTNNGKSVVNVSIAVYAGKSQNGDILTDWFRWTIWGDRADRFAAKARKGDAVMFDGRGTVNTYTKDGQEIKAVEFVADDYMIQKKEMQAAVTTSVRPQEYSFPDFPNDEEPLPWQ